MARARELFRELQRRNVFRATVLYVGAVWALAQGISQLSPAFGLPEWVTRWFVIACAIGFPFWVAFAWYYELTPEGIKRESEVDRSQSITHRTGRKLDYWIICVLAVAVVLLVTNTVVWHKGAGLADQAAGSVSAPQPISAKSVAVLPFENLSDDKNNEYFVAGMQDLILTKLAGIGDLKVISRTSTAKYPSHPDDVKAIGHELGVASILEGSVQKAGNHVLIDVQLIDARSDAHVWAQDYTRNLDNIFGVEGEVAGTIAAALKARLSAAQTAQLAAAPTTDPAAYDLFLRADFLTRRGLVNYDPMPWKAAIPLYRQAIANDPGFALAWARLSYTEISLYWFGGADVKAMQVREQALADAEQALKLAPNLAASQIAIGYSDYWGKGDYAAALKDFDAALALRPNDADALAARGYVERRLGHSDAAIASLQQAQALDPRNGTLTHEVGSTFMQANRFAEAETWLQRALVQEPDDNYARVLYSNAILFRNGDVARALAAAQGDAPILKLQRVILLPYQRKYREAIVLLESVPDTPDNFSGSNTYVSKSLQLASLYRLAGDDAHARPLFTSELTRLRTSNARHRRLGLARVWQHIAMAELGLGHTQEALDAIATAQALVDKSQDLVQGSELTEASASLYAQAQRPDLAMPLLAKALSMPDIGYNYAPVLLWLDPAWDPSRHDPRFQALLRQYAKYKPPLPVTASLASRPGGIG